MGIDRRIFLIKTSIGLGLAAFFPSETLFAAECDIQHPLMPPNMLFTGQCQNCGMQRPMWARTWHTFNLASQKKEVCSLHCLAEMSLNTGIEADNVVVAKYLTPEKMLPVEKALYVVGSHAKGTMTISSKLAFSSTAEADSFISRCGGRVASYKNAQTLALQSVGKDNTMIQKKRVKNGKIVEPEVGKHRCPVCNMEVAQYPNNKCQIQSVDGTTIHFCATQCLFEFIKNHDHYKWPALKAKFIWVVDYDSKQWIYGRNSYYVVGTNQTGPMGKEAFPFINMTKAKSFAKLHGGKVLEFSDVNIEQVML